MMKDESLLQHLQDNPDFLTRHYQKLLAAGVIFPSQSQGAGTNVIDVTSTIASKARKEARHAHQTNQSLLNVAAENMLHWQELHLATLGLLACHDYTGFAQMIHEELPLIFGLTSTKLMMPARTAIPQADSLGFSIRSEAEIKAILQDDVIYMGPIVPSCRHELAPESASMAIIRLPDQLPMPVAGSLLLLGGRQTDSFGKGKGQTLLLHLAEMVGVCLLALIESQAPSNHIPKGQL